MDLWNLAMLLGIFNLKINKDMNSIEKFRKWRENQSVKSEVEKHNLAFKISIILTIVVIIFVVMNWYLNIFGVLPENSYLTKMADLLNGLLLSRQ